VVSVGLLLAELTEELAMGGVSAGMLTSLPVIAFAVFGALTPAAASRTGMHRLTLIALCCMTGGLFGRSLVSSSAPFLVLSLIALAGMAVANVLLPSLVKQHFPNRIGLFTSLYSTSLALGLAFSSVLTVPLAEQYGSWRGGLAFWAATAAVAAVPWLLLLRHDAVLKTRQRSVTLLQVARTRIGWAMALLFGLQASQAYTIFGWFAQVYRDAGFSSSEAGLLLGVITGVGIPLSLWAPAAIARTRHQTRLMLGLIACYPLGYLGLLLAPVAGAWVWAILLGVAISIFPVMLTMIALRTLTAAGTAALSGFSQSVGYAISGFGPFGIGMLYHATGSWAWPMLVLSAMALVTGALAIIVGRPQYLEDYLGSE
jgi:CP family cyanate transporter-like MFS transporter